MPGLLLFALCTAPVPSVSPHPHPILPTTLAPALIAWCTTPLPQDTMSSLMELKVVSPISTGQAPFPAAGASFAFAINTEPRLLTDILGHAPDHLGAQYRDALRRGHTYRHAAHHGGLLGHGWPRSTPHTLTCASS
eukprot:6214634-Pleurochrysis_carterae.AAC.5